MRRTVEVNKLFSLDIGYVGENNATEVAFDFTSWAEEYGSGSPVLRFKRNLDEEAYPVTLDVEEDNLAVWTVSNTDLLYKGQAEGQLQFVVDDVVKKSRIFSVMVSDSLVPTEDTPDPYDDWMDDLIRLTGESETNAYNAGVSASNAATSALNAATSEANAGTSATNAANSATAAGNSASQANTSANDASASATQAGTYAGNASASATQAQGYANDASASATLADGYADSASDSATAAQGYASDASDSADSASASAEEAKEYADQTERSIPSHVRLAIYTLLENAAYATIGLTDEIEVVQSWAEEVQSLVLSDTELELEEDTPQVITAVTIPYGATVSWTTSNPEVATVDNGIVTGVSNGSCTITASAGDLSATCDVTVSGFAELVSISAVYTQSGTVYDTDSLNSLKSDLVVTALYSDASTATISAYTLSGTLTAGTSTITVAYSGKTTTFNVTVSQRTIRVFKGKGVSGASIVDNANRALSEPVPFENVAPISVQFVDFSATKVGFKNTTTDVNTIDTTGITLAPDSVIGTSSSSGYDGWSSTSDELFVLFANSGQLYRAYQYTTTSGYTRLLFANNANTSIPISETIQGIIKINGIPYHLVEADVSDFE